MKKSSKMVPLVARALLVLLSLAFFLRSTFADTPIIKVPEAEKQYTNGVAALGKNDLTTAEADFKASLNLNPKQVGSLVGLAEIAMREHKPQIAQGYLKQGLSLAPTDAKVRAAWGGYLYDQKDIPGAIAALKQAIVLDPAFLSPHLTLADIYLVVQNQPKLAADEYRAALKIDPKNFGAHYALGEALERIPDWAGALAEFQAANQLAPTSPMPLNAMGQVYAAQGQSDKASDAFERALKVQPKFFQAHVALGDLYGEKGDTTKALAEYRAALQINPKLGVAYTRIGMIYDRESKPDDARSAFESAIAADPNQADAYNNLAWHATEQKTQLDQALSWATKAVALEPQNPGYLDTLGWVLHTRGEPEKAVIPLKNASALAPKDPEILYHLGVVYQESGKKDLAADAFNKALSFNQKFDGSEDAKARIQILQSHQTTASKTPVN